MKGRNYLWSLFAMIIATISLATFTSCKEEEEEIDENGWVKTYPKSENYDKFTVTNINGEIKFNKKLNKYEFIPDNTKDFRQKELIWGDEGGDRLFIIIENNSKEIGNHLGKITISGIAQFKYAKVPKGENPFGLFDYYYSLKIDNYSGTKTRAFTENIVYICDTPVSNPPAWLFSRSTPSSFNFISYNFKLYVHIVRSSEGEGYSSSISNTILNNLNNYYNGSNISFSLIGTDYINNDNYNLMSYEDASKPKANGLFNQNSHTNAII